MLRNTFKNLAVNLRCKFFSRKVGMINLNNLGRYKIMQSVDIKEFDFDEIDVNCI
jgi:hypothetical protein